MDTCLRSTSARVPQGPQHQQHVTRSRVLRSSAPTHGAANIIHCGRTGGVHQHTLGGAGCCSVAKQRQRLRVAAAAAATATEEAPVAERLSGQDAEQWAASLEEVGI